MRDLVVGAIQAAGLDTPNVEVTTARALPADIRDWIVLRFVAGVCKDLRGKRPEDSRQGWLALPEYAHVPAETAGDTLGDLRTRIRELEKRIRSYGNERRKPAKLKADKLQLLELKRLERNIAPLFAMSADLTVDEAARLYEDSNRGSARKQRQEAIKARWNR